MQWKLSRDGKTKYFVSDFYCLVSFGISKGSVIEFPDDFSIL